MKAFLLSLVALFTAATGWSFTFILNSNTGLPIKWPPGTVNLQIMLGTAPTLSDGNTYNTSAQGAAQTWNAQLGSVQFQTTIASGTPVDHNHVNEVAFAADVYGKAFDATTLAVTTTWRSGNQRTEADVIFNTAKTWDSYDGPTHSGVVDLQRVAIHEFGHVLGLDHPDEAGQTVTAVMNSHVSSLDTLASDDISGGQSLYGPPGVPANDDFANAIAITLGSGGTATVNGYNTNASKQLLEPNHAGNAGGRSVWWKWTAPSSGSVTLDTRGSYFDTTLGVYTGSSVAMLTTVASNDDINPGVVQASTVTFNAVAGTTYFFAVDGFDADSAGITLNLSQVPSGGTLPTITTQPTSVTTTAGTNVAFSVTATAGASTISYQWFFGTAAVSGATGSTLSLNSVQAANAGSYFVTVSTGAGSVNSSMATLTVNPAVVVTPPPAPMTSGGGGGGAPSLWFYAALSLLGAAQRLRRRNLNPET